VEQVAGGEGAFLFSERPLGAAGEHLDDGARWCGVLGELLPGGETEEHHTGATGIEQGPADDAAVRELGGGVEGEVSGSVRGEEGAGAHAMRKIVEAAAPSRRGTHFHRGGEVSGRARDDFACQRRRVLLAAWR
jgi:hypothetical protein